MQAEVDARIKAVRRRERLLPAVHPRVLPAPRGRARRGVQPRARGRHDRGRQGARGAGRGAPHQRDGHRRVHGQVDPELPRPAAAAQPVGERRALGAAPAHSSCAPPSSSGRRGTPRTPPRPTRTRTRCASSTRSTRTSWSTCSRCRCVVGHEDGAGAFPRRRQHVHARGDDGRRQGAADGHEPRARSELRRACSRSSSSTTSGAQQTAWTTSWGVSTRMVGGSDHGARRRRRPARPAPARARSRSS